MGWNGAGTIVRTATTAGKTGSSLWQNIRDMIPARKILAIDHDEHDEDLADAIQNCVALDGQNSATANLNLGGFRYTNAGNPTARTDLSRVTEVQDGEVLWGGTDTGLSGNALVIALSPAITAYVTGCRYAFKAKAGNTNTGAATLNAGGGAKSIKIQYNGSLRDPIAGEIVAAHIYEVLYDGTQFILLNPERSTGSVAAAGTTQGTATAVTYPDCTVSAADGVAGVVLPSVAGGMVINIMNTDVDDLFVYPATDDKINGQAVNIPIRVAGDSTVKFIALDTTNWYAQSGYPRQVHSIAAAGNNLATAEPIVSRVTCVTGADDTKGVALPSASTGLSYTIYNSQAGKHLHIYNQVGDTINGVDSSGGAHTMAGLGTETFLAVDGTDWCTP